MREAAAVESRSVLTLLLLDWPLEWYKISLSLKMIKNGFSKANSENLTKTLPS
jgi:hypothetical protein